MTKPVRACQCQFYRTAAGRTTGCTATTTSKFAPGHDAKLKSFLVLAGADGEQVIQGYGGVEVTASAVEQAQYIGYGDHVADGVDREVARRVARKLGDMGQVRSPKVSDELAEAARRSDEEWTEAERKKIADREASAEW